MEVLNFYSLFCTTFFTLCSGFVLLSSAAGSNGNNLKLFAPGEKIVYNWKSTVLLNEIEEKTKTVGFSLRGKVVVSSVWASEEDKRILSLELVNLKLHAKPEGRFSRSADDFVSQVSKLDSYKNKQFLVVLNKGKLDKIFLGKDEHTSLRNIKKGIASLFQIQSREEEISETDASGHCKVLYNSTSNTKKVKSHCTYDDVDNLKYTDQILGTNILSNRQNEYIADDAGVLLKSVISKEDHKVFVHAKQELGCIIAAEQILTYEKSEPCGKIEASTLEEAINILTKKEQGSSLTEGVILSGIEVKKEKRQFSKDVGSLRESLKSEYLGTVKSAKAFLQLLEGARTSSSEEISKVLKSKKNEKILYQLYDILGYTQSQNSHKAVMKHLHLDSEEHTDLVERYLWSLSFSIHTNIDILEDLLSKYRKYTNIPDRIRDTLILSLASMARTISRSHRHDYDTLKVLRTVEETIINGFDYAKDDGRYVFLNALKNLQSPSTLPKLMTVIQNGTLKEEVLAWRALKSFGKPYWTDDLLKQAEKTLYQLDKKHDPSSRALAVDVLLGAGANELTLQNLLNFVASNDTNFEIRQYVFQSIKMLSEKCEKFSQRVKDIIKNTKALNNNYSSLSPRGLSTALTRNMFIASSVNGSLVSIQEIKGGIVKRGVVDVVLEKDGVSKELFTLGIFASGLSSFVSSNSDEEEDETSTAGMELTVMGTQIRPFVFFEGHGELMGHVWSGTASEITPAFQALILSQDHEENLRLGNGFVVQLNLKGAVSFDLSGKMEVSIWNRNAQSLIEKSVGFVSKGLVKIDTSFINSQVDFEGSIEPKLSLEIDADFSNKVKLCMRLSQPDSIFRHGFTKLQAIPGSKYHLKLTANRKNDVPGKTYALNRKNNEMCSAIFS